MITIGTACSGIGGGELAAMLTGIAYRSGWAIEIAQHQSRILDRRFGVRVEQDVYGCGRHNLEPVDVFMAGFPCQAFSIAGRRMGVRDPRNLWPEIARITAELEPPLCVFENVPALRNPHPAGAITEDDEDTGEETDDALPGYLGTVLGDLADLGYHVAWDGRSAASIGAHHRRDRIWIVAWKPSAVADFDPFWPTDRVLEHREIGSWNGTVWEVPSLFGGVTVMRWPRAGIVRGNMALEVSTSSEANGTLPVWQTPTVGDATGGRQSKGKARPDDGGLRKQLAVALWPTATANDALGSGSSQPVTDTHHPGTTLTDAGRSAWNTPTASGSDHHTRYAQGGRPLLYMVEEALDPQWATPASTMERGVGPLGSVSQIRRERLHFLDGQVSGALQRSGLLNPRWVEALMGYPPGWTELEDAAGLPPAHLGWGADAAHVGDIEGTNPAYARHWLWHEALGIFAPPLAPRVAQTKDRLIGLGNAWVPQVAASILARCVAALP